jgi:3-oxoacyl-[acyl-carrier protein] reductase
MELSTMRYSRKTVVVTGASRGIGRAMAQAFAREGGFVAIGYRVRREEAEQTLRLCTEVGGDGLLMSLDVRDPATVRKAFDEVLRARGRIDVLVNNAAVTRDGLFAISTRSDWDDVISTNLSGISECARAAVRPMMAQGSGAIINVSSTSALRAVEGRAAYATSKAGVLAFTRSIARELAPHGVRVNALVPGFVDGGMAARMDHVRREQARATVPAGRFATSEEVAAAALFLASDDARYIIGHALIVDGGLSL